MQEVREVQSKKEQIIPYFNDAMISGLAADVPMPDLIVTDPNGSYTGRPADPDEKPVQDADDL